VRHDVITGAVGRAAVREHGFLDDELVCVGCVHLGAGLAVQNEKYLIVFYVTVCDGMISER